MKRQHQAFAMVPLAAVFDLTLSHAELRALSVVALHRDSYTGWTQASHAVIAADLGLRPGPGNAEHVRKLLQPSIKRGYLTRVAGGGRKPSRYRVSL